jgi:hypothetical protein
MRVAEKEESRRDQGEARVKEVEGGREGGRKEGREGGSEGRGEGGRRKGSKGRGEGGSKTKSTEKEKIGRIHVSRIKSFPMICTVCSTPPFSSTSNDFSGSSAGHAHFCG